MYVTLYFKAALIQKTQMWPVIILTAAMKCNFNMLHKNILIIHNNNLNTANK